MIIVSWRLLEKESYQTSSIRNNPSNGVMAEIKKSSGKNKGIRHALTIDQQRAFLGYIANSLVYCHWLPLFTALFGTGCRIGEMIGLRWEDLDYEKRLININHAVIYMVMDNGKSEFHVSTPKTEAGTRVIPMMDAVRKAFQDEYEAQKETGSGTLSVLVSVSMKQTSK